MPPDRLTVIVLDDEALSAAALRAVASADVVLAAPAALGAARHLATPRAMLRETPASPDAAADVAAACSGTIVMLVDARAVAALVRALGEILPAGRTVVLGTPDQPND